MRSFNRKLADRLQAQMSRRIDFVNVKMLPSRADSRRLYRFGDRLHQALVVKLRRVLFV